MNYVPANNPLLAQLEAENEKKAPKSTGGEGSIPYWDMKETNKTYYWRPLPSKVPNTVLPFEEIFIHYGFHNPNTERNGAFPCLSMWGLPCPLCDKIAQMKQSPDFETQEKAKELEPSSSYLMYVQNMQKNEVGYLSFSGKRAYEAFYDKFKEMIVESQSNGTDLDHGVVFQVDRTGVKLTTKYAVMICDRNHALTPEHKAAHNELPPILEVYGKYTQEDYYNVLNGVKFQSNNSTSEQKSQAGYVPPQTQNIPAQTTPTPQTTYTPPQNTTQVPQTQTVQSPQVQAAPAPQNTYVPPQTTTPQNTYTPPISSPTPVQAETTPQPGNTYPNTNANSTYQPSVEELQQMLGKK